MSVRTTITILLASLLLLVGAALLFTGCSQSSSSTQAAVYQDPPEMTATYDSLEALAANTGTTLGYKDYEGVYQYFLEKYPNSTALHRDWQSTLDAFNMTEEKIAHYKELHEQNPNSAMYAYLYGRCLPTGQDRDMFKKAVDIDPNYFWGHFGYAVTLLRNAPVDTATAIDQLKKSLEIDKTYPSAYTLLAGIYETQGDLKQALDYARTYAKTSPDSYRPITLQEEILNKMDRGDEAEKLMLKFANDHTDNTSVRADLVEHFKDKENYDEALKWQYEYVKIANDPGPALVDVAKLHLALDEPDSALYYLNQAAGHGYANWRRVSRNPELAGVRKVKGFDDLMKTLKDNAETARNQRLASFLQNADENRAEVLKDKLNEKAPDFSFKNLDGETVALKDLRGKVVVIDFWATWCGPCRMTMPVLQEFVDRKPDDVEFLSLNVWEDDQSKVAPFIADYGYDFNVLLGNNQVASDYGVTGIPTMVVIDPEGMIQYRHVGYDPHVDQILLWQTADLSKQSHSTQAKL